MTDLDLDLDAAAPSALPTDVSADPDPSTAPAGTVGSINPAATTDTTSRLMQAAAEVFAEKGYDRAGVAEIARRAGLTTGAIYGKFSGKAELLAAAITACVPDEFDQLFAAHGSTGQAKDFLYTLGAHLVSRPKSPMQGVLLEALVAARRDPELAEVLRAQFDERRRRFAQLIEIGKAKGIVDASLDTECVVHFAHAVGLGFLAYDALGAEHPASEPWEAVIGRVVAALDPGGPDTGGAGRPDPASTTSTTEPDSPSDPSVQ